MTRRELREQIFLLLFRVEFNSVEEMPEQVQLFFEDSEKNFSEEDHAYIADKFAKLQEKLPKLDEIIASCLEKWDITRIGKVELTVLRLAAYEIRFDEDIPEGVAANEAVELAKKFGQENSGGFVNAIITKILKKGE